jgi:DNA helicase-2/ATP-dependent DNA helicase PcrA
MSTFAESYVRLNADQKKAVDTIEGPVMVVAGPGTGKTQVLSLRVANILVKTQANPSNILCLTFSSAGATAMRDRLRKIIGGDAYAVTVNTVHGFCDGIIKRHPMVFSEWSSKKSISDIERYKAMQKLIDQVSGSSSLINPKNPYDRIPAIFGRISDCKREGLSLDDMRKVADEYDGIMAGKSKVGTKQHQKNLLAARKFRDFIDLAARYADYLEEKGLYDYDDMILTVIKALKEEEWLLSSLQERYQYMLVDEAQDLNGAQWKVIQALTTYEHTPQEPNFFLVGDDDQAIYRFQGANVEHMLSFRERFPNAPVIVLTTNYRSTQKILDAAGRLIARNEERLIGRIPGLQKDLKSFDDNPGLEPTLLRPASDTAEPWLIADLAEERIAAGMLPEEIAVLVQTNGELRPIYDVLRARNIPVVLQGKADLLAHPIVREALLILRSMESTDDTAYQHAISCPCFSCHPADIARVTEAARSQKKAFHAMILELEQSEILFTDKDTLLHARDVLEDLRVRQESRSVLESLEHLLRQSGITAGAATIDPLDLAVIEAFFQYVKQCCLDHPSLQLRDFLHDLRFYADEEYGQIRLTYQIPHLVTSGVQLLTAHQSKGLEFGTVILSSFREGHWDERRNPSQLAIPEDLLFGWESDQKKFEKHQDERRVAYVAMTRAKKELFMLCPREFAVGERARSVSPSAFFAEAGPLPEENRDPKNPEKASLLLFHPTHDADTEMTAYLKQKLENFALSPSSLATFLEDPELFKRVHLLNQPQELKESAVRAMGYGSAVHWALRKWAEAIGSEPLTIDTFMEAFEWHLREKNILTEKQRADLFSLAQKNLPLYFQEHLNGCHPFIYTVERDYRAEMNGIPLKGKIDRIDRLSENASDVIVIDFKTGAPKAPGVIRGSVEEGKISRTAEGAYFRQLAFYALLIERAEPLLIPQTFRLAFIGEREEEPINRDFTITEEEKADLKEVIQLVWEKIQNLDFTPLT